MSNNLKAKDVLAVRAQQIASTAELLAQQTSDWQVIQAYVTGRLLDLQLTPVQEVKLQRYQFAYNQLVSGKYTENEVCEMIQSTYGLTYVQALQDIRESKEIFASSVNINKLFEIRLRIELNKQYIQMAVARGDLRAAAAFEKNGVKLADMLPEAESTAAEHFEPHKNIFVFDPSLLGYGQLEKADVDQLLKDINDKYPGKLNINLGDIEDAVIVE